MINKLLNVVRESFYFLIAITILFLVWIIDSLYKFVSPP